MTTAPSTKRRPRRGPSRGITIAVVIAAVALLVVILWASMTHSGQPGQQQRVAVPGQGEHLVNLWTERADSTGGQRLTAQVTDIGGWPAGVSSVIFSVSGPGMAESVQAPGAYSLDGPGRGQVYNAVVDMAGPGPWQVTVRFVMGGQPAESTFTVEPD